VRLFKTADIDGSGQLDKDEFTLLCSTLCKVAAVRVVAYKCIQVRSLCCSVLQCVAVFCSEFTLLCSSICKVAAVCVVAYKCIQVRSLCCSVLQRVASCCSELTLMCSTLCKVAAVRVVAHKYIQVHSLCCSVLQRVAACCCSVLQRVAASSRSHAPHSVQWEQCVWLPMSAFSTFTVLQCVAACCSVSQRVHASLFQSGGSACGCLQVHLGTFTVLQCVAVCCNVVHCGVVYCSECTLLYPTICKVVAVRVVADTYIKVRLTVC